MKNFLYILVFCGVCLISCSEELDTNKAIPKDCIYLNIYNSPLTKAVDETGSEYERQLNRLDCFFYVDGQADAGGDCIYYQKVDVNQVGQAEIPIYVNEATINRIFPTATTCDVLVIANLPSGTFESGGDGTDVTTLGKTLLKLDGTYDAVDKPFVMAGLGTADKGNENNASGTIPLYRAAAKVTVSVNVPSKIKVNEDGNEVTMIPVLEDNANNVTLKTSFHHGVTKTYLRENYVDASGSSLTVEDDFFQTEKYGYNHVSDTNMPDHIIHKYSCEIPFYTYARAWEMGAADAAYLTFEMPWGKDIDNDGTVDSYATYYYQILINASGRKFEANHWYDLTVNVGVLGSTVESEPVVLKKLTYHVLDWTTEPESDSDTGDRYEDVIIENYTYLIVQDHRVEINNASTGEIRYDASHKIAWKMNTSSKIDEVLGKSTKSSAFYIYCGGERGTHPQVTTLLIGTTNFTDNGKGSLTYSYEIPDDVYSPVYVYLTIWLDIDGDGELDQLEEGFQEDVVIVQYPPIYIIPDQSTEYSIFVNKHGSENENNNIIYDGYRLGVSAGTSDGEYMYTVNVTSFKGNNTFAYNLDNNPNGPQTDFNYIIGDPRVRVSDTDLNNDGYDMDRNWATASDVNGVQRKLQYYYPTSEEDGVFQIIAPKFRVVSFLAAGHNVINSEGAKMRCASFQEDGFPAGRWRLPTFAEIQFIIMLQREGVIQPIYYGGSKYFSSTNQVQYNNNYVNYMPFEDPSPGNADGSVRCVYDEWYWGSEREARENENHPGGYEFTWGDEKIW